MRLIRAEISGFGYYRQQSFDFLAGNQLFYGENEAGKSTLYHFIQAMLFGFPKRGKKKRDYTPTDGAAYGGKLWIDHPLYGEVLIERFKQGTQVKTKVQVGDTTSDEEWLTQILAPLTLETFQDVFTFQQEQLSEIDRLQEKELQEALISLGISGSAQMRQQRVQYEKENQKLYKLKGQVLPLNRQLKEWQQLKEKIEQKEQQEATVQQSHRQILEVEKQVHEKDLQRANDQQALQHLKQQALNFDLYEEWQSLAQVVDPRAQSQQAQELAHFYQRYQQITEEIQKKETEIARLESGGISDRYFFFLEQETQIQQLLKEKTDAFRKQDEYQRLNQSVQDKQSQYQILAQKWGWQGKTPELSDPKIPIKIEALQANEVSLQNEQLRLEWLDEQIQTLEEEIKALEQQLPELLQNKSLKQKLSWACFGLAGLILTLSFLVNGQLKGISWAFSIASLLLGLFFSQQQNKAKQQKPLWQEKLAKKSELAFERANKREKVTQITQQILVEKNQLQPLFGQETRVEKWPAMLDEYNQAVTLFLALKHELQELAPQKKALSAALEEYAAAFTDYQAWLPLAGSDLSERYQLLESFNDEMQAMKLERAQNPATILAEQLRRQKNNREELFVKFAPLLRTFGLTSPLDVPLWSKQWQEKIQKFERKEELSKLLQPLFPKKITRRQLEQQIHELTEKQALLQEDYQEDLETKQRLKLQLEQLQADGTLDELYQEETKLKSQIETAMVKWGTNRLLSVFLEDLANELSEQQLPEMLHQATHYFNLLTSQRYEQVTLNDGQLEVLQNGEKQTIYQLSTGTKDQLIMALRFAYLSLQKDRILSPIIIDDGWLHYDRKRKRQLAELFVTFGQDYQIICLSSDQEMVSYYQEFNQAVKNMK
ncbi:ATP-binding protein [Enterococcus lemanii]|uniref:AAA family ATPase n=1 Tax=Enterococcus lemanii TaxID=1159752 RepID=A0ABV9MV77_9ENTE|nr:AAA family ATPase [Enterococcus lemanii]MBM7709091.1 uncharacterized protein YhaN [Enterococcus lemanii]